MTTQTHQQCETVNDVCSLACDTPCAKSRMKTGLAQRFLKAFFNAVDLCFDDVYQEPQKILMVGGCRQRDFAQHIALLLPAAEITLIDPDPEEARKAQEEICCRFKFIPAQPDELPFEDGYFDLVFAHNFFELAEVRNNHWKVGLRELFRVTSKNPERRGNVLISWHRVWVWQLLKQLPGVSQAFALQGNRMPFHLPDPEDIRTVLGRAGAVVESTVSPLPWQVWMTRMLPVENTGNNPEMPVLTEV